MATTSRHDLDVLGAMALAGGGVSSNRGGGGGILGGAQGLGGVPPGRITSCDALPAKDRSPSRWTWLEP